MNLLHEWPLVLFTLAVQAAVGLHLAQVAAGLLQGEGGTSAHDGRRSPGPSLLVGGLMVTAMAISLLHLGTPLNARLALANLDQSWLSREILAALLFLGFWGAGYLLGRRPGPASWVERALSWATGMAGLVLIWIMARLYMVPARPLWDHWLTPAGFFSTTVLLGATTLVVCSGYRRSDPPSHGPFSPARTALVSSGLAAVLAQVGVTFAHPVTREAMVYPEGTSLVALRLLLLLGGALILSVLLFRSPEPKATPSLWKRHGRWSAAALLLLVASEVVGRLLFYAVGTTTPF